VKQQDDARNSHLDPAFTAVHIKALGLGT